MSNYTKKAKNKGVITGVVSTLAVVLVLGGLGAITNGFKDWKIGDNIKEKIDKNKDTRVGLRTIDLKTDKTGAELTSATLISYLNGGLDKKVEPIFKDVQSIDVEVENEETHEMETQKEYSVHYVYQDNGGMKFGSSKKLGSFSVNLVEDYTFNRIKIVGRNYSAKNNQTGIYSCDESSIIVNGEEAQVFGTNEEETTLEAPTEEKVFEFDEPQDELSISVLGKRATIFTIEMWTETTTEATDK